MSGAWWWIVRHPFKAAAIRRYLHPRRKRMTMGDWTDLLLGVTGFLIVASVMGIVVTLVMAVH